MHYEKNPKMPTFRDYKGEIMFVSVTVDEEEHKRVLDFFGIWTTPTFRIANVNVSTRHAHLQNC